LRRRGGGHGDFDLLLARRAREGTAGGFLRSLEALRAMGAGEF
jgi:hypothetical protein